MHQPFKEALGASTSCAAASFGLQRLCQSALSGGTTRSGHGDLGSHVGQRQPFGLQEGSGLPSVLCVTLSCISFRKKQTPTVTDLGTWFDAHEDIVSHREEVLVSACKCCGEDTFRRGFIFCLVFWVDCVALGTAKRYEGLDMLERRIEWDERTLGPKVLLFI